MNAAQEAWRALDVVQREALRILVDIHLIDLVNHWDSDLREGDVEEIRVMSVAATS